MANDDPKKVRAARRRIQTLIEEGSLKPPDDRSCVDCGATAVQYDHVSGYDNPENVEPVCAPCHSARTATRSLCMSRVQTMSVTLRDGTTTEGGWVDLFPPLGSQVHYRGEVIEINQSFAARILANFTRYLTLYGKEPVMLRQHEREGWCYGVWANLRLQDGRIQGLAAFLDETALERFKAGTLREWSPGFGDVEDPHTGELLRDMLVEASFVDRGHQWNLRPPSATNQPVQLAAASVIHTMEQMMPEEQNEQTPEKPQVELASEEEEEVFDMASAFSALSSTLTSMAENQSKILAYVEKQMAGDAEEEDAPSEMAALQAEVKQLRRENTLKDLEARGIKGAVAEGLVTLKAVAPEQYETTVAEVEARFDAPTPKVQPEIGGTGQPASGRLSTEKLVELASQNVKDGHSIMPWIAKNHPDRFDEVRELRGL